jgi:hypothetical protein
MRSLVIHQNLSTYKDIRLALVKSEVIGRMKRYGNEYNDNNISVSNYAQTLLYLKLKEDLLLDMLNNGF